MSELMKNLLMWLFIAITMFSVFSNFNKEASVQELSYSEFISQVESDQVLSVEFSSDNYTLKGKTVNGESFEIGEIASDLQITSSSIIIDTDGISVSDAVDDIMNHLRKTNLID